MAPLVLLLLLLSLREYSSAFNSHGEILNQKHKLAPCFLQRNSADQLQHQQLQHQQLQLQHQQLQQQRRQILLSGDIHSHPGPTPSSASGKKPRRVSYPCTVCDKGVTKASKAVSCDACNRWTHVKCSASISLSKYNAFAKEARLRSRATAAPFRLFPTMMTQKWRPFPIPPIPLSRPSISLPLPLFHPAPFLPPLLKKVCIFSTPTSVLFFQKSPRFNCF